MSGRVSIAVLILTYNESVHLSRALRHISGFAREIFVIDSYSTDTTVEIAQAQGATVLQHKFQNHAKQMEWAIENAPISTDWVMRLDADEIVEQDLAEEIVKRLPNLPDDVTGINLNRKTIFQGKFIRFGGRYPLKLLRIWRRGKARIEDRWMDEHMYLTEGHTLDFAGGFADHNLFDLTYFTEKHNRYASREALDVLNQRMQLFDAQSSLATKETVQQARVKRMLKELVYNRIPYEISAAAYFFYRYVVLLGFLDGREGFNYHILQGFWYRFLVGAKLRELEAAVRTVSTKEEIYKEIERLTRQRLDAD